MTALKSLHRPNEFQSVQRLVGRSFELERALSSIKSGVHVLIQGPLGSGKSAFLHELGCYLTSEAKRSFSINCRPSDSADSLWLRVCRLGGIAHRKSTTHSQAKASPIVIVDNLDNLSDTEKNKIWATACQSNIVFVAASREACFYNLKEKITNIELRGLSIKTAKDLWQSSEHSGLNDSHGYWKETFIQSGGHPGALLRLKAQDQFGHSIEDIGRLSTHERMFLELVSVLNTRFGAALVQTLNPDLDVAEVAASLWAKQMIRSNNGIEFEVHSITRSSVLDAMPMEWRIELEAWCANCIEDEIVISEQWRHPMDRLAQISDHRIAASDQQGLERAFVAGFSEALQFGFEEEFLALLSNLKSTSHWSSLLQEQWGEMSLRVGKIGECASHKKWLSHHQRLELSLRIGKVNEAHDRLKSRAKGKKAKKFILSHVQILLEKDDCIGAERFLDAIELNDRIDEEPRDQIGIARALVLMRQGAFSLARRSLVTLEPSELRKTWTRLLDIECLVKLGLRGQAQTKADELNLDASAQWSTLDRSKWVCLSVQLIQKSSDGISGVSTMKSESGLLRKRGDVLWAWTLELACAGFYGAHGELGRASSMAQLVYDEANAMGATATAREAQRILSNIDEYLCRGEEVDDENNSSTMFLLHDKSIPELTDMLAALDKRRFEEARKKASHLAVESSRKHDDATQLKSFAVMAYANLALGEFDQAKAAATLLLRSRSALYDRQSRVWGFFVLAALAHQNNEVEKSLSYAQDASDLAQGNGLELEELAASAARGVIAFVAYDQPLTKLNEHPASARLTPNALSAVNRFLGDLGFVIDYPYQIVDEEGHARPCMDIDSANALTDGKEFVINQITEELCVPGKEPINLKRRTLLKQLLFLFGANPGRCFSKEELVESVWNVEYHPLRHDAALFTNIMRMRRLIGDSSGELLGVCEQGYCFHPQMSYSFLGYVAKS